MKNIRYSIYAVAMAAVGLTGCQTSYDAPEYETPEANLEPNTTIADLKKIIFDNISDPEDDMLLQLGKKEDGKDYIIHGRIITSDASGNIYQQIILQDETAAIPIPIRRNSIWTNYRVGQEVVVNVSDLYIGTNACYYEIGWLDDYIGEESLSYLSWLRFLEHSEKNGDPNQNFQAVEQNGPWPADNPYYIVTTIDAITSLSAYSEAGYKMMGQYVELQDVEFEDGGKDTFAQYQESNEYRFIKDSEGNRIPLNNSGYSTFHNTMLPEGKGTIRAILSYYQFSDYDNKWQLTLIDIDDVMFDMSGNKYDPYTVEEAIAKDNNGRTAWTQGYIVGSVKSGVSTVTSSDDIEFGAGAESSPNNLVIADSATETDWTKCMVVALPQGSMFQQFVNLVENDYMVGQLLTVRGTFSEFMGMHGIIDNGGGLSDFVIDGMDLSEGYGTGDQDNPFTVEYVLKNPSPVKDVWVEGYIVGFVAGTDFSKGAVFGGYIDQDYNGANVIISSSIDGATVENSIPVKCDRNVVGLIRNPGNLGKKVKFLGNIGQYMGTIGMDNTTDQIIE